MSSRQPAPPSARVSHGAARLMPPVKPVTPSMTSSLRWSRRSMRSRRKRGSNGEIEWNSATRPPDEVSSCHQASLIPRLPTASWITSTFTPSRARAASASRNRAPTPSAPIQYISSRISRSARAIASSIAGNASTPSRRRRTESSPTANHGERSPPAGSWTRIEGRQRGIQRAEVFSTGGRGGRAATMTNASSWRAAAAKARRSSSDGAGEGGSPRQRSMTPRCEDRATLPVARGRAPRPPSRGPPRAGRPGAAGRAARGPARLPDRSRRRARRGGRPGTSACGAPSTTALHARASALVCEATPTAGASAPSACARSPSRPVERRGEPRGRRSRASRSDGGRGTPMRTSEAAPLGRSTA